MKFMREENFDPRIAIAELSSTAYPEASEGDSTVAEALHRVASELDWAAGDRGPFGNVIPAGARVLIKPNFVTHRNEGPWGIEPLVTHQSLVRAAVEGALRADPAEVLVGDAPMQACDFDQLLDTVRRFVA